MLYLLDTNAFTDYMRGHAAFSLRVSNLNQDDQIITCVIVVGEIRFGIERLPQGKNQRDLQARADWVLARVDSEPVPVSAAERYSQTKVHRQKVGKSLDENDLWVAATALALGAVLISRDTDFNGIPGLAIENWTR
jgi:tRNA(fMet)-specific endonuclease VapC